MLRILEYGGCRPFWISLLFVAYTYIVNDFGTQNSFFMLFSSLGLIFILTYIPNPIWRPSAILEKSSSLVLTPFSCAIPLLLLILACRIHFWCYFYSWGSISMLT